MSKTSERILAGANEATRRLNPHLFKPSYELKEEPADTKFKNSATGEWRGEPQKRIRQETKPLMNKLESQWFENLKRQPEIISSTLRAQAKRFRLANGAWYKPDITALSSEGEATKEIAWECKGPKQMKGMARGMLTIKVAASQWPEIEFRLVWKQDGRWHQQIILP